MRQASRNFQFFTVVALSAALALSSLMMQPEVQPEPSPFPTPVQRRAMTLPREPGPSPRPAPGKGELDLEILNHGSAIRVTLRNISDRPLEYRDVLFAHDNELGYPWMTLNFRSKAGDLMKISDVITYNWSPYMLTDHVYAVVRPLGSLEQLAPHQRAQIDVSTRDLMRGLPDSVRQNATRVKVSFRVPLDKQSKSGLTASTEWFAFPEQLRTQDLLHGRHGGGSVYRE